MASLDSIPGRLPSAGGLGPSLSPEQAERVAALSPVLIAVSDSRMRLTFTSPALQRVLGWSGEELAGRNWLELLHAEDIADAGTALGRARDDARHRGGLRRPHRHARGRLVPPRLDRLVRRRPTSTPPPGT